MVRVTEVLRPGKVRMVTTREEAGVRYQVFASNGGLSWERFVRFGRRKDDRAGGAAFREAARKQEITAAGTE